MKKFKDFKLAKMAAQNYFKENFGYNSGVGIEAAEQDLIEFYSKDDPAMLDTFCCIIENDYLYYCQNGGKLRIEEKKS